MNKIILSFLFSVVVLSVSFMNGAVAQATDQDMAQIKCSEFINSAPEEMQGLILWMDGYMSAMSDNTVLSNEWLEKFATHLGTYCSQNKDNTIMQAMDAMPAD